MAFFRNFTSFNNLAQNADIELQDIEEGSGSVLTSSNTPASTPIFHPLSVFTSNLAQNPEIRDIEEGDVPADIPYAEPLGSEEDTQTTHAPIANPLMPGDYTMTGPDNPHPESHALEHVSTPADIPHPPYAEPLGSEEDTQTTHVTVPIVNPLMPGNYTMTGPNNPHLESHALKQHQLPLPAEILQIHSGPKNARKRSHHGREGPDKVRVVEQSSQLPREKAVHMSKLIEQKYENQFQHQATEFADKMVEQFKVQQRELEKQYKESKQRAEEADERAVEATQKVDDALKRASVAEEQARQAIEKAQMMERRYLEMMSRGNRNSEPMEVETAATVDSVNGPCSGLLPMDCRTIRERNKTPDDDASDDDNINLYGLIMSEDGGDAPGLLLKGKGRDTGDDRWGENADNDEQLESVGPEVPSSYYNDNVTIGETDFNGRMEIPDELGPETEVPPPRRFRPRRGGPGAGPVIMTSESQSRRVRFNDDAMEGGVSASIWAQPQPHQPQPQHELQSQDSQPQRQTEFQPQQWQPHPHPQPQSHQPHPQPQPQHPQGRPHQASWKGGVVGLYGACTSTMDPISGVQVIGGRTGRAPRMFRQPPKRKSDVVKAAKQTALRKCVNELMGIEKDTDLKMFAGATPEEVKGHEAGTVQDPVLQPMRPYLLKHAAVTWNESLCNQFVDHYQAELGVSFTEDQRDEVAMMFDERLERMSRTWQGYQKEKRGATEVIRLKMEQKAKRTRQNSRRNGLFKDRLAICAGNMRNRDRTINPEWKASYDMVLNLGPSGMSSDESEEEDGRMIYIVKARCWRSQVVNKRCKTIDRDRKTMSSLGGAPAGNPPRKRKRVTRPALSSRDPVTGCPKNYYSARWAANLSNRGVGELNEGQNHDLCFIPGEESD